MEKLRTIRDIIDVVIYHYPCMDGFASAYVVNRYYKDMNITRNIYYLSKKIDGLPIDENIYIGKNVLMVDIVTSDYKTIKEKANSLVILDHHKTSRDNLTGLDYAYFNMSKSGVGLAWEYFYENQQMPYFLQTIQDRDLWTFKLDKSREFNEGLYNALFLEDTYDKKNNLFDNLYLEHLRDDKTLFNKYYDMGVELNRIKQEKIKEIASSTEIHNVVIDNKDYRAAISNCSHDIASDLGNYLVSNTDCDFAILWRYDTDAAMYYYSLRSTDKKTDVSAICKFFGGGGHRNAAGCESKEHPTIFFACK